MRRCKLAAAFVLAAGIGGPSFAQQPLGPAAARQPSENAAQHLPPAKAGARYGQALGVALACYGLKTTPAVNALEKAYSATEAELFRATADKVVAGWREALSCSKAGGPNECRLIHEWSCRDALKEIGPEGNRLPGLVAPAQ